MQMAKAPSHMEFEIKIAEDGFNKGSGKDFTFTAKKQNWGFDHQRSGPSGQRDQNGLNGFLLANFAA